MRFFFRYIIVLFCFFFTHFTYAETDAVIINTMPIAAEGLSRTSSVDTGITIENGDVWIWGYRDIGLQGNGVYTVYTTDKPQRVNYFVNNDIQIVQVSAGIYSIIALDNHGDVWAWGQDTHLATSAGLSHCKKLNIAVLEPCLILKNKNVISIVSGEYFSIALTKDGTVYTWGHNIYGQTANPTGGGDAKLYQVPATSFGNRPVVMIGGSYEVGYAINSSGEVYAWGYDSADQFGYPISPGYRRQVYTPVKMNIDGRNIKYICGGYGFTEYLTHDGTVYGLGVRSKLGLGFQHINYAEQYRIRTPQAILKNVKSLYCRYAGSIAITDNDELYVWGSNEGASFNIYSPKAVSKYYYKNLTKLDGGKESFIYWNDKGKAYGVGYGAGRKFSLTDVSTQDFPGISIDFVITEMKKVYGQDYTPGLGY